MQVVLFVPEFVLSYQPDVLRACPMWITAEQGSRIRDAVERMHVATEAEALQPFHVCAHKDPAMRHFEAIPEALAIGFLCAGDRGKVAVEVCDPAGHSPPAVNDPMNTTVVSDAPYEGAVAFNELREALLHHKKHAEPLHLREFRPKGLYGVLVNLRLAALRKLGGHPTPLPEDPLNMSPGIRVDSYRLQFAIGLPLYDASGFVIDLRRYCMLRPIGGEWSKSTTELLNRLSLERALPSD